TFSRVYRRTLLRVFRPVFRQQLFQMWSIVRTSFAGRAQLINRVRHPTKTKLFLKINDRWNLISLPTAWQPPTRIGVEKNATTFVQVTLNQRHQIVAGPPATGADS